MGRNDPIAEPALERQGRRMIRPALRFLALALLLLIPGVVVVILASGPWLALGAVLILLSTIPGTFAFGLLASASVVRWAARHKLFA